MRKRIARLLPFWRRKRLDILVTHAPPRGHGDAEDIAHWGFEAFLPMLEKPRPRYLLHGHVHTRYEVNLERVRTLGETTLVNCCERYILELPDMPYPMERHGQIRWITRHKE
jgi:Icc-related predicted phosphoesterase